MESRAITELKGIGEKTAKLFLKLGITSQEDLIGYYPHGYDPFFPPVSAEALVPDRVQAVEVLLPKTASVTRFGGMEVTTINIPAPGRNLNLVWYRMPYLRGTLKQGETFVFRGRVTIKRGRFTMEQPEIFRPEAYRDKVPSMQPVYGLTRGLGNKTVQKAVKEALEARPSETEYLPESIRKKWDLQDIHFAREHIHFPENEEDLLKARRRLVFDEFFLFLITVQKLKEAFGEKESQFRMKPEEFAKKLLKELPYALTGAQQKVLGEISADLGSGHVMSRLIQGDVGSGKTILAALALITAAGNGFQGALMAPTEVLARQHFESFQELFRDHGIPFRIQLLTGSMAAGEKKEARRRIEAHEADIIIGTHALIQEKVRYDRLALVITDEQHRFGVGQRESLGKKGEDPHILVMSATPIPRTLATILYGDLDISVIDEVPARRLPIKSCVVGPEYRENAYRFIEKEVSAGHQAYVICPMVEPGELENAENVLDYCAMLKKKLPPSLRVEYLHGKMKPKDKNAVMERFAAGEIDVLVSTTVIEVGINVPNASVIMIENAERFGLAGLHQLRGRVGRGSAQSYCILVNTSEKPEAAERLEILNRSNDGFFIANEDLRLRGPGDIFGVRQSGALEFRLADIYTDAALLSAASEETKKLLASDPGLSGEENRELCRKITEYTKEKEERVSL